VYGPTIRQPHLPLTARSRVLTTTGGIAIEEIEVPPFAGGDGFAAQLVLGEMSHADLFTAVSAMEALIDEVAKGQMTRGRPNQYEKHGDAVVLRPNVYNYVSMDPTPEYQNAVDGAVLGSKLVQAGCHVSRFLAFGEKGSQMTWHVDSGANDDDIHRPAKTFMKIGGSFARKADTHMPYFWISHSGPWVYSMTGLAFLGKKDGGWGGEHSAGSDKNEPSMSIKIRLPDLKIASTELMSMVLRRLLSLELHQREAPPMRTQAKIRLLRLCGRGRRAAASSAPRAIEKRTVHLIGNNAIKQVFKAIFSDPLLIGEPIECPADLLSGHRCLRAEQKATLQFGRFLRNAAKLSSAAPSAVRRRAMAAAAEAKAAPKAAPDAAPEVAAADAAGAGGGTPADALDAAAEAELLLFLPAAAVEGQVRDLLHGGALL